MGCGASTSSLGERRYPVTSTEECTEQDGLVRTVTTLSSDSPISPRSPFPPQQQTCVFEDPEVEEKLQVIRDVYIFRHLAQQHLEQLVQQFELRTYQRGDCITKQHEMGDSFFVIASGEVAVQIDGAVIRHMAKNAYLGERALLFDEPRTATVKVVSNDAECWAVAKAEFLASVTEKMRQLLMYRIRLQDTTVSWEELTAVKFIGSGAMGCVQLVKHRTTGTHYALKKVKKEGGVVPSRCLTEVHLLAMNDHPFVLQLVRTFETEAEMCMLTELVTGGELFAAIRSFSGLVSREDAQFYIASITLALESLHHRRILYRDLKPENVLLDAQGYVKLIDFGVAVKLDTKRHTFTVIGTPHYMAPEVIKGRGYGLLVDIWSMGVIMYELVCGFLPFGNDKDVPEEVFKEVVKADITFPSHYRDEDGISMLKAILHHDSRQRLGANGYTQLKKVPWFRSSSGRMSEEIGIPPLFSQLLGRELEPPVMPDVSHILEDEEHSTTLGMALVEPPGSRQSRNRVSLVNGPLPGQRFRQGRSKLSSGLCSTPLTCSRSPSQSLTPVALFS